MSVLPRISGREAVSALYNTYSLSKTVFSVKPLFKRFKRFEKSLYGLKRPIFESELVQKGSHIILRQREYPHRRVVVPDHH